MFVTNSVRNPRHGPTRTRERTGMSATATSPDIRSVPSAGATAASASTRLFAARWIVLAVVLAADVMDLIDATIVNVAGPTIRHDLGGGASTLQWLGAAYTLTFAVLLVTGARLGDIFGRRRLFLVCSPAVPPLAGGLSPG